MATVGVKGLTVVQKRSTETQSEDKFDFNQAGFFLSQNCQTFCEIGLYLELQSSGQWLASRQFHTVS